MSNKKASNDPGLCLVEGQKHSLGTQTGSHSLILKPVFGYYQDLAAEPKNPPMSNPSSYILPRDSQGRLRSN